MGSARATNILGISAYYDDSAAALLKRKKLWLAPIILVMILLGALIVFAQGSSLAPFIYTLF